MGCALQRHRWGPRGLVSPHGHASGPRAALCLDSQPGRRSQTTNPAASRCAQLLDSACMQGVRLFVYYSIYYQT